MWYNKNSIIHCEHFNAVNFLIFSLPQVVAFDPPPPEAVLSIPQVKYTFASKIYRKKDVV